MQTKEFTNELKANGIEISTEKIDSFFNFANLLISENSKYNLTNITELNKIFEKHFFDSLSLLFNNKITGKVCDVGSGCGMPGIPLKIIDPNLDITFLDSSNKKINFLKMASQQLNQNNSFLCCRSEETNEKFDTVVARGVAQLNVLLEIVYPLIKEEGIFIAMKGSNYKEELKESKKCMEILGYNLIKTQEFILPEEKALHCNLFFKLSKEKNNKYPRKYSEIKKKPL